LALLRREGFCGATHAGHPIQLFVRASNEEEARMNIRYRVELSQTERAELTALLSGGRKKKATDAGTVEEMVEEFDYKAGGDETDLKSVIIVDETLATGKTIAATLKHLRNAGMPQGCRIAIAVWGLLQE